MNKKMYQQPRLRIVNLHCKQLLGSTSGQGITVKQLGGNAGLTGADGGAVTGGNEPARGRQFDSWDEEE
ncbi:MAG: hypothetical protein IJ887_08670 [Prevotella sp.]|nr:hypothetical protein [Prevotella sp.]MBR3480340.1 hypothetical protein [Prevotella sp.]